MFRTTRLCIRSFDHSLYSGASLIRRNLKASHGAASADFSASSSSSACSKASDRPRNDREILTWATTNVFGNPKGHGSYTETLAGAIHRILRPS